MSKFRRLALTHAAMMAGEAAMVVALADSFFFDVDPNGARSKVLGFLLVSFAPFLLVAPFIGPVIDRIRGGRRFVVELVAAARIVLQLLMVQFTDDIALFLLIFLALVLQKTYVVSKSALVPSVVRNDEELVEANSKLGLIAGVTGVVAVIPAGALQLIFGSSATLVYGAALFGVALVAATRLPRDRATSVRPGRQVAIASMPSRLRAEALAMLTLRVCAGLFLFHLAFWFRTQDSGTVWFGVAVVLSSLGTMAGNATAPIMRRHLTEKQMMTAALVPPSVCGLVAAAVNGRLAAIGLAAVLSFSAAIGRLSFESIVQRDGPATGRGELFARFETRFQFGWVVGASVPVLFEIPGALGFFMISVLTLAAVSYLWIASPTRAEMRSPAKGATRGHSGRRPTRQPDRQSGSQQRRRGSGGASPSRR